MTVNLHEWALEQERKWNSAEEKARKHPLKAIRLQAGLYFVATEDGEVHTLEHATLVKGFANNEWTISSGNDLHHDQHKTLQEALDSLGAHL